MLDWKTYHALPALRSYEQALAHWEKTKPIRGDAQGTKPVGRRDQKWLSIYKRETDNAVCIGSIWWRAKGKALLAYYPDGRVSIEQSIGASCRERIQRIAGLNIRREHNEDWVQAVTYQDGKEVKGHFPLKLSYHNPRTVSFILRDKAPPIYLNPVPAITHIINRQGKAAVSAKFKEFTTYLKSMGKLMENKIPRLERGEMCDMFETNRTDFNAFEVFKGRWSPETDEYTAKREKLFALASSGDTEQMYKAMLWLSFTSQSDWRSQGYAYVNSCYAYVNSCIATFDKAVMVHHKDETLIRTEVRDGRVVKDRYASYVNLY